MEQDDLIRLDNVTKTYQAGVQAQGPRPRWRTSAWT